MQVPKESRPAGGPEQPRNGKAAGEAKPRGLEGDWRAAKEKNVAEHDRNGPEGETPAERMRREFEEERQRLQDQRKKGGHTAQRAAKVRSPCCMSHSVPLTGCMAPEMNLSPCSDTKVMSAGMLPMAAKQSCCL